MDFSMVHVLIATGLALGCLSAVICQLKRLALG